jgi:DNA-binding NarL/FixJ family response regulator
VEDTTASPGPVAQRPVLIADEDADVRALVSSLLEQNGFTTREASCGEEALAAARLEQPGLVLLEVRLPGLCGYEVCHQLRDQYGENLPIVFLSADRTESYDRVAGLLVGADDYVVKPFAADELLARLRRLIRRETPIAESVVSKLTKREVEILGLLAQGLPQQEIAAELFISPKTVGTHIEHILGKLGVRSRAQAVAVAYREHLSESRDGAAGN